MEGWGGPLERTRYRVSRFGSPRAVAFEEQVPGFDAQGLERRVVLSGEHGGYGNHLTPGLTEVRFLRCVLDLLPG